MFFKKGLCCLIFLFLSCFLLSACGEKEEKKRITDYKVCKEWELPDTLRRMISERKEEPFHLCYEDSAYTYAAAGYGKQKTEEYVVAVENVYENQDTFLVELILTSLRHVGERPAAEASGCPFLVLRMPKRGKRVIFQ